ncbi:uncharacterized protein APUU_31552A [Aspergillus puulaauensis]|uniref:Uncharacterized protein n=1 Tax=Aspergillus puulaauensis TaxID=1220207 RepID=A0A7R7XLD0_9EURO|nr:uncharacterized protein APUU_31552A [Aspergillus puulaauensis]BCS23327.1 hypothetical protein APUU_31552A [Aspergillus puulaauensis]
MAVYVCTHKNNPRHTRPAPRSKVSGLIGGGSFPLVSPPFESFCRSGFSRNNEHWRDCKRQRIYELTESIHCHPEPRRRRHDERAHGTRMRLDESQGEFGL